MIEAIALVVGLVLASLGAVAWRMVSDERARSAARVAALAAEIHQASGDVTGRAGEAELRLRDADRSTAAEPIFAAASHESPRTRLVLVAAIGALAVGVASAAVLMSGGERRSPARNSLPTATTEDASRGPVAPKAGGPLELLALGHERDADGLTVRGLVRNPSTGAEVTHLTAVVLLFNRQGGYLASGRAAVQAGTLGPGGETTFVVTVSGAPDADRYRVSFRTDRDVIPHVDRRS